MIGGLVPPIVFWFLIGTGLGTSVRVPGAPEDLSFLQYFYAGTLVLIVLFTSIFATISIIEDRREGFPFRPFSWPRSRACPSCSAR